MLQGPIRTWAAPLPSTVAAGYHHHQNVGHREGGKWGKIMRNTSFFFLLKHLISQLFQIPVLSAVLSRAQHSICRESKVFGTAKPWIWNSCGWREGCEIEGICHYLMAYKDWLFLFYFNSIEIWVAGICKLREVWCYAKGNLSFYFLPFFPLTSERIPTFLPKWNLQPFSVIKLSLCYQHSTWQKVVKSSSSHWTDWTCNLHS